MSGSKPHWSDFMPGECGPAEGADMTDRALLQRCLDGLDNLAAAMPFPVANALRADIAAALAQPAQGMAPDYTSQGMPAADALQKLADADAALGLSYASDVPQAEPTVPPRRLLEAAIAWSVCASIHEKWAKGKDALYTTRQADFLKHAEDARAMLAAQPQVAEWTDNIQREVERLRGELDALAQIAPAAHPKPVVTDAMRYRAARALADRSADECNVDREDNWKAYGDQFVADAHAALSAALGVRCPDALLPDGPKCPRCGGERAPPGVDGGSWVHYQPKEVK
jgi:hypothetical protein